MPLDPNSLKATLHKSCQSVVDVERVALNEMSGRVLAERVVAPEAYPSFDRSAVDGFAIHYADLCRTPPFGLTLVGRIAAGGTDATVALLSGETIKVATGAVVPAGAAAIVMQEDCEVDGETVRVHRLPARSRNVRLRGEDLAEGSDVLLAGTELRARQIALLAAIGCETATVFRRVKISIFSTGNELLKPGERRRTGRISDSNRPMLISMLSRTSTVVRDGGQCDDDPNELCRVLKQEALDADLIVSSGAAGGSETDHLVEAAKLADGDVHSCRLALKPGKPVLAGKIGKAIYLGLPGNPLAAFVTAVLFCEPVISQLSGLTSSKIRHVTAVVAQDFDHKSGRRELIPVRIAGLDANGRFRVTKVGTSGSANLKLLADADGMIDIPLSEACLTAGSTVTFYPFHEL